MKKLKENRRGVSSVVGMILILTLIVVAVASMIGLETSYRFAVAARAQMLADKRAENFILIDAFPDGSRVRLMNRGVISIHIVSVYVNHRLTSTVTSCEIQKIVRTPCLIPSAALANSTSNLAWVTTGTKMLFGDNVTVTSDRGNRAAAIFPIGRTGFSSTTNLFLGAGPLTIIFQPGSFNYTGNTPIGLFTTPQDAWAGVPASSTDMTFYLLIVNHGLGDIELREESVLFMTSITGGGTNTKQFCIADPSSPPIPPFTPYNRQANPVIIPDNPSGDLAAGGPPVLVKFAATGASSCNSNPNSSDFTGAQVSAVLLGFVYYWNGDLFSQDIPMATLLLK